MEYVVYVLFIINILVMLKYHIHMFQLNGYKYKKHLKWLNDNMMMIFKKMLPVVLICIIVSMFNVSWMPSIAEEIIITILLLISIFINFEKNNQKIKIVFTARVKRMIITSILLMLGLEFCFGFTESIQTKLTLFSFFIFLMPIIASLINTPIEKSIQKSYINKAKKILNEMPNLKIIGVTGSFGKTSVKTFLAKILGIKYNVLPTPKNYNTTMGVVKTIRENLRATDEIFICEMGATKLNDIKEICDLVHPEIGIITSVGPQHMESFKTIENVVKTKFELADSVIDNKGTIFLNGSNDYIFKNSKKYKNYITYGLQGKEKFNYVASNVHSDSKGLHFTVTNTKTNESQEFVTEVIGEHNVINITGAVAIANNLGISMKEMVPSIRQLQGAEHRLQLIRNGNISIIDDSYNSNPVSSKSAIDTLCEFEGEKILVTPGLIELGDKQFLFNEELGEYAAKVDFVYIVGKQNRDAISKGLKNANFNENKIEYVATPQEAVAHASRRSGQNKVILLENDLPDNYR